MNEQIFTVISAFLESLQVIVYLYHLIHCSQEPCKAGRMIFIVLIHACTNQVPGAVNKALRGSVNMELVFGLDKEKKTKQDN